jgi:hypothetical protein
MAQTIILHSASTPVDPLPEPKEPVKQNLPPDRDDLFLNSISNVNLLLREPQGNDQNKASFKALAF